MTHKEYLLNSWIEFYTRWAYAPLYAWVTQLIYLGSLAYLFILSINGLVYWMENSGEYTPIQELIFWGWTFGIIAGVFVYRWLYSIVATYILMKLNLID